MTSLKQLKHALRNFTEHVAVVLFYVRHNYWEFPFAIKYCQRVESCIFLQVNSVIGKQGDGN